VAKTPKLSVDTARSMANSLLARLTALVPNMASDLSPSLAYLPAANIEVDETGLTGPAFGWTAPDLNNGQDYTVQVECFGAGGGGGGGSPTVGGGGGGGSEYACEPEYPIKPNETYSYFVDQGTVKGLSGGSASAMGDALLPGANGSSTHFDYRGKGLTGGVVANGGQGGDQSGIGTGGRGGTGSVNTIHFDGGDGGSASSGVASDNPGLGMTGGIAGTVLNWRLDDKPGTSVAFDYGTGRHNSSSIVKNTGAIVLPTTEIATPVQIPFGSAANWDRSNANETAGACWKFDHGQSSGYIGGIIGTSFPLTGMTTFSVSCWIKGLASAASANDWGDTTAGQKVLAANTSILSATNGWILYLDVSAGQLGFRIRGTGGVQTFTATAPAANDGNWHMCTVTYGQGASNFIFYVDGVAVATTTATVTAILGGSQPIVAGFNVASLSNGFKGYMSNLWASTVTAPLSYIQFAYGNGSATGGAGGGASGGSAGAGNAGVNPTGSTAGAGGASSAASSPGINHGSGAGGAGGNASVSNAAVAGASGPPSGGGGGGSGILTPVGVTQTVRLPCNMSGSYTGFDSQGMAGGQLYTVSANPQADVTSPWYSAAAQQDSTAYSGGRADSPFQGSMFSILTFPAFSAVNASASGSPVPLSDSSWTIDDLSLQLTVSTENACNIMIGTWKSNTVFAALPSDNTTLTSAAYGLHNDLVMIYVDAGAAGRQVTIDLSLATAILTDFKNQALSGGCGLILGQLIGSSASDPVTVSGFGAWNDDEAEDWNCAFTGANADDSTLSAELIVKYHPTAGAKNSGGKGAPGYIVISYLNPEGTPVATVLPAATTDAGGNGLGAGFTADATNYHVWHPGSSPLQLETWQTISGYSNSWARLDSTSDLKYILLPGNLVLLTARLVVPATFSDTVSQIAVLPVGYRPLTRNESVNMMGHNAGNHNPVAVWGTVSTAGALSVVGTMNGGQTLEISSIFPINAS
jgi:hypothetical protein